eukprot:352986-Chlamydomonas_euryale.AAC.12
MRTSPMPRAGRARVPRSARGGAPREEHATSRWGRALSSRAPAGDVRSRSDACCAPARLSALQNLPTVPLALWTHRLGMLQSGTAMTFLACC